VADGGRGYRIGLGRTSFCRGLIRAFRFRDGGLGLVCLASDRADVEPPVLSLYPTTLSIYNLGTTEIPPCDRRPDVREAR
jgi:hypothetical protein